MNKDKNPTLLEKRDKCKSCSRKHDNDHAHCYPIVKQKLKKLEEI